MAVKSSGSLSLNTDIAGEFGGSTPHSLSEYKRGGSLVPNVTANNSIPTTNSNIQFSDFYGAVDVVPVIYEIIGGGGEGAGGYTGTGNGAAGGTSSIASISGTSFTTVTAAGGAGGTQPAPPGWNNYRVGEAGQSSYYGSGGAGGYNSNSDNQSPGFNASGYGAGGGGGGAHPFSANNGGGGGKAGTRRTGTLQLAPGSVVRVTIGGGGAAIYGGGNGRSGYAKLTTNGVATNFYSTANYTVPS